MPTYVCTATTAALTAHQQREMAQAITRAHSDATGAPPYFVQVVFDEKDAGARFLGGNPTSGHVWIRGDIRGGRTDIQKASLMQTIMTDVAAIAGVPTSKVWVYLCDLAPTDMIEYGHVLPKPGTEQAWFDSLPHGLQEYLMGLGERRAFQL